MNTIGQFQENVVEKSTEQAKKAFKKVFKWKRSVPDFPSSVKQSKNKKEFCKRFLKEGEWKFCESFQSEKQCQPRCSAEKSKESYCSQLKDHALKLNDFIKDLEAAVEVEQQLASSALQLVPDVSRRHNGVRFCKMLQGTLII